MWASPFWAGTALSILNYPTNIFDYVRNGTVEVHVADVDHVSPGTVHLSSGVDISSDGLVFCTGWQYIPPIKFLPEGIAKDLGLPYFESSNEQDPLVESADKEILARFPRLADQPVINPALKVMTGKGRDANRPFRLYRFIAPPTMKFGRSIAFTGMYHSINTTVAAEVQALWIAGYLTGKMTLDKKSPEERKTSAVTLEQDLAWEATLVSRWSRWRTPGGDGSQFPDIVFDNLPYFDILLQDLGLPCHRKKGLLADWFVPYGPADFRGLTAEWMASNRGGEPSERVY